MCGFIASAELGSPNPSRMVCEPQNSATRRPPSPDKQGRLPLVTPLSPRPRPLVHTCPTALPPFRSILKSAIRISRRLARSSMPKRSRLRVHTKYVFAGLLAGCVRACVFCQHPSSLSWSNRLLCMHWIPIRSDCNLRVPQLNVTCFGLASSNYSSVINGVQGVSSHTTQLLLYVHSAATCAVVTRTMRQHAVWVFVPDGSSSGSHACWHAVSLLECRPPCTDFRGPVLRPRG